MVQSGAPEPTESNQPAPQSDGTPQQEDSWSGIVRNAATDFSRMVTDSSQQLTAAAEKLASDSMSIFGDLANDLAQKTEQATSKSNEMAAVATQAAAETSRVADSIQTRIDQAVEKAREETKSTLGEPARQAEQALQASEKARIDLQQNLDEAVRRIEASANAGREAAAKAERAAEESHRAAVEASARADRAQQALEEQQGSGKWERLRDDLQGRITQLSVKVDESASVSREATARSETIANEARQTATEAAAQVQRDQAAVGPTVDPVAQEVLERLEADYSLLTKLVQELHSRIATLSGQAPALAVGTPIAPASETESLPELGIAAAAPSDTPLDSDEQETTLETHRSWYPGGDHIASPPTESAAEHAVDEAAEQSNQRWSMWPRSQSNQAAEQPVAEEPVEPAMEPVAEEPVEPAMEPVAEEPVEPVMEPVAEEPVEPAMEPWSPTIAGLVLVSISPVPDFDRLLNLDGALGRMTGIENVTLADYAKEEVTFRVEIEPPTSLEDFRERLSQSADAQVEVVSSGEGTVALGLVG